VEDSDHPVVPITLKAEELSKSFNRRIIFKDISFSIGTGASIAITGKNGSGKSTLMKIVAGLLSPSFGKILYEASGTPIDVDKAHRTMGFVAPYLQLYEEFTALENIELFARMRTSQKADSAGAETLLRRFNLWNRRNDFVRGYSSGMKQRLKYVLALGNKPGVLMLDEPSANLDEEGSEAVKGIVSEGKHTWILAVATNDEREAEWCSQRIHVGV